MALFTFKGGVGKTTLTQLLAHTLALIGITVLVVDGDRQMNITTFFKEYPTNPQLPQEPDDAEEEEDPENILAGLSSAAARQAQHEDILASLQGHGYDAVVPAIIGDPLDTAEPCPMTSDYMIGMERDGCDDIVSALLRYKQAGPGESPDIKLRQVQTGLYNGENGRGKIYLLPGNEVGKLGLVNWWSTCC